MQRYIIDTGSYSNGYSAEPDEDGQFVYADDAEARIAALESQLADRDAEIERLRAKLDSEASHRLSLCADNERFVAENAELRADLVWAVQSAAIVTNAFDGCQYLDWDGYDFDQDGTPESICRAVREARDGEADS